MNTKSLYKYYGGKANIAQQIVKIFPPHKIYCEPFFGSGAVFFSKPDSPIAVINDKLEIITNFWRVARDSFEELKELVNGSIYSRDVFYEAYSYLDSTKNASNVKRAWALWYLLNFGFGGKLGKSWGYRKKPNGLKGKLEFFNSFEYKKLQDLYIENKDAIDLFKFWDGPETLWYCDPPYVNTDQGHYSGYSITEYKNLLETLAGIRGKFILSSYPNQYLEIAILEHNWESLKIAVKCNVPRCDKREGRTEILAWNFAIGQGASLFGGIEERGGWE